MFLISDFTLAFVFGCYGLTAFVSRLGCWLHEGCLVRTSKFGFDGLHGCGRRGHPKGKGTLIELSVSQGHFRPLSEVVLVSFLRFYSGPRLQVYALDFGDLPCQEGGSALFYSLHHRLRLRSSSTCAALVSTHLSGFGRWDDSGPKRSRCWAFSFLLAFGVAVAASPFT